MDNSFFRDFNRKQVIERDDYLGSLLNRVIIGRGIIKDITSGERYKKTYRVRIESSDSGRYNNNFVFLLYLDNKNAVDLLSEETRFEFKGQLDSFTPLNSKRTEYILEVLFIEGSTVIE